MTFLARAPALPVLAAWSFALIVFDLRTSYVAVLAAALLAVVGLLCLGGLSRERPWPALALAVIVLSLAGPVLFSFRLPEPVLPLSASGEGKVLVERSWGGRRLVVVDLSGLRLVAFVPARRTVVAGSRLDLEGKVLPLRGPRDGETFDFSRWARARGIVGELVPSRWDLLSRGSGWPRWRGALEERLLLNLPPLVRGHLLAAWLGLRDPDLAEAHRRWGTAHLLAVSGFHVGLVAAVALILTGSRRDGLVLPSLVLWTYVLLAGAAASALRAALMIQLYLVGRRLGRPGGGINAVSLAGLLLLAWRPWWFWDVGWRLSMTAALTLAALPENLGVRSFLLAGPAVWLTTAPLSAGTFGAVPLAGLVLNLAALPLFGLLLPLASVAALPALWGWPGGPIIATFAEDLFAFWVWTADGVVRLVPALVVPSALLFAAAFFVFFLLLFRKVGLSSPAALGGATALALFCSLLST
jgi:competence protein ComEC